MPTPFENLDTVVQALMADVNTASPETVTLAPTNYGTDFRITPGDALYQVQISPSKDFPRGNQNHPRAEVVILIHHHVSVSADEVAFLEQTISHAADTLLDPTKWRAEANVYDIEPDTDPEIASGEREGNVITFEITATVLMDAV